MCSNICTDWDVCKSQTIDYCYSNCLYCVHASIRMKCTCCLKPVQHHYSELAVLEYTKGSFGPAGCWICSLRWGLCRFQEGEKLKTTSCQHVFHEKCLNDWLNRVWHDPTCPEYSPFRCSKNPYEDFPFISGEEAETPNEVGTLEPNGIATDDS